MAKLKVVAEIEPKGNFPVVSAPNVAVGNSTLDSIISGIDTYISNKVDKVTGKGLSTEDYTTAEKNKLSGIETNANNYVHPTTSGNKHIPSGGSSGKILGWSADGTAAWVDPTGGGGGDVSSVKVGSTTYNPDSSGVVSLPAYPTTLPASDVYSWAKASSKPTYTASDVGLGNVGNFKAVSTVASQGLSTTEKSNARTNIGAGTVTDIKLGSMSFSPISGVVSLPDYPTSLPADGGTAANVSGTVAVAHGGTGATSASSARTNLGLGSAATKSTTTSVTSGSSNLITSGGVYNAIGHLHSTVINNMSGSSDITKRVSASGATVTVYCLTSDSNAYAGVSITELIINGGTCYAGKSGERYGLYCTDGASYGTVKVQPWNSALLLWNGDVSLTIS